MELILASNNLKKLEELRAILSQMGHTVVSQREAGLDFSVEETGDTFLENAALKAVAVYKATGKAAIADDSGLCVEALDGRPGVHSAYYGGDACQTDRERTLHLLKEMQGITNRKAYFVSRIYAILPDETVLTVEGRLDGEILKEIKGEGGFGYDPVFYLPAYGKTLAQMKPEEKNNISHRAVALGKFKEIWEKEHGNNK